MYKNERLIVKSFGPIKELDITFKKVTLFIGDQGTGKSCVAKLFSMFVWLEKVLSLKKYPQSYFEQYNRFKSKLCSYHRIDSFICDASYIRFEGNLYNFVYDKGFRIEKTDKEADGISKIMYIPAERSIVSVAENKSKLLKELPDSSETFSDEFVNAKNFFQSSYELPFEGLRFEYDSLNDSSWIHGDDYKVRLINASSGIQSSLPMCMVSEYLCRKVADREEIKLSKEEKAKLEKRVAEIMKNNEISDSIKDMMIRQLSSNRYDRFINVVEEPELNLFPLSQMQVLFSLVAYNALSDRNKLVVTTHSPYSLAIINTMIMGAKAFEKADNAMKKEINDEILSSKYHISVEEIAAYRLSTTDKDYCKSVINPATRLISKNDLDAASDDIMRIFNSLYQRYAKTIHG